MCFEGPGKKPVDVVVAVVGKDESPVADVFIKIGAFEGIKLYEFVTADITKGILKDVAAFEVDNFFLEVYGDGGVFDERVEEVCRHALVGVPVS